MEEFVSVVVPKERRGVGVFSEENPKNLWQRFKFSVVGKRGKFF